MKYRFRRSLLGFCLAGVLALSGCSKPAVQTPTPSLPASRTPATQDQGYPPPAGTFTEEPVLTAYPGPGEAGQSQSSVTATPDGTSGPANPYPAPGLGNPAQASSPGAGAYPGPGSGQTGSTPAAGNTYPGPGESSTSESSQGQPTAVETPQLVNTATVPAQSFPEQAVPTATSIPGTPGSLLTLTPGFPVLTPTGTPFIVRPTLVASDPDRVRLASGKVQMVEFFGFWSISSRSMAPVIHALEEKYKDQMNFVYLDVDDPDTGQFRLDLGYRLIPDPHFFLLDGAGNVLQEWTGYVSEQEFEEAFAAALGGGF